MNLLAPNSAARTSGLVRASCRWGWLIRGFPTLCGLLWALAWGAASQAPPPALAVNVEVEEDLYVVRPANNGAGPMWSAGSATLVRHGDRVFASGIETLPELKPLNNVRWMLFERDREGWRLRAADPSGRTREPCPLGVFDDGRIFLSGNPTLLGPEASGGGEARPDLWWFQARRSDAPVEQTFPVWEGNPKFSEHSYRSLAVDGRRGEFLLLQNIGYTHAEWTLRDRSGAWSRRGRLMWPEGSSGGSRAPVRVCYPALSLRDRRVAFFGVSDIVEPNIEWRAFKRQLTGQEWDYDFRRLFYTWTPDVGRTDFAPWVEISSREPTAGFTWPCDLWQAADGDAHLLWTERAIDTRLREKFFPGAVQSHTLHYAVVREGAVRLRRVLFEAREGEATPVASAARFHADPAGRLFVVYFWSGGGVSGENRIAELRGDGVLGTPLTLPLRRPFTSFFTASERAGSRPSRVLDLLGMQAGRSDTITYARVRLR